MGGYSDDTVLLIWAPEPCHWTLDNCVLRCEYRMAIQIRDLLYQFLNASKYDRICLRTTMYCSYIQLYIGIDVSKKKCYYTFELPSPCNYKQEQHTLLTVDMRENKTPNSGY